MDNVLCTPHLGANTDEAQVEVAIEAVDLLINYLSTGEIRSAVNTVSLDPKTLNALRHHLDVAYRLGLLLAQWHGGAIDHCQLEFQGELAEIDSRPLVSAFCAGLIGHIFNEANIVNSEMLCRERGIEIVRTANPDHSVFSSMISATVSGDGLKRSATGTLFGKNMPRLVKLDDYQTETFMDGNLMVFDHSDIPGIIGYVGNLLGEEGVNIAQMAVGRNGDKSGGRAIGVLNIDSTTTDGVLEKITKNEAILSAELIQLPLSLIHI